MLIPFYTFAQQKIKLTSQDQNQGRKLKPQNLFHIIPAVFLGSSTRKCINAVVYQSLGVTPANDFFHAHPN